MLEIADKEEFYSGSATTALSSIATLIENHWVAVIDKREFKRAKKLEYQSKLKMFEIVYEDGDRHLLAGDEEFIWLNDKEYYNRIQKSN